MKLKKDMLAAILLLISGTVFGQDSTAKKPETAKIKSYAEVITAKAVTSTGLFATHRIDEKYYFEIPDSLLEREILFTTRLAKVATGSPAYGGEVVNSIIVSFEKAEGNRVFLRASTNVAVANPDQAIAKAVRNSTINPIIMVMDVKARNKANNASVIDVTDFILKDNNITGFGAEAKKVLRLSGAAADRSYILSVNTFNQNIEIKTVKTFAMGGAQPNSTEGGMDMGSPSPSAGVTMEISNSIMLLSKQQMQARYADPRVGFHSDKFKVFADDQQKVEEESFIVRQRLEPKKEEIGKYKSGELVEPKQPIVYYVDPATPKQWRPYIIAGINDWNEAFKAAGFKNAIVGKEWPENDTTMSIEDARWKVVRYFPSGQSFSYAPRIYDPRSGEILQAYIGWSHNNLKSLHDWYFVQASAVDSRARSMKFSDELMGALIRAEISRQIGYSLGLKSNLAASSSVSTEKLRDKNWIDANGFSASIMDFIHYNYVAQPGDNIAENGLIPKIGDYDKWAIKYGYSYTDNTDFEKEKKEVLGWIAKIQTKNPALRFSTEGSANMNDPMDPTAQTEDLGNNPVKSAEYGLNNLKIVAANLLKWTREDMDMYDNAASMYDNVLDWWGMLTRHVYSQVGGVKENLKTVDQSGDVYTPVSKEMQKQAVAFLNKEVFQSPTWLLDANLLNKFSKPAKREKLQRLQENAMFYILNAARLYRMYTEAMRYNKEQVYTINELMTDLNKGLWSELKMAQPIISTSRRALQKSWLENLNAVLKESTTVPTGAASTDLTTTDIPAIVRAQMNEVMLQCKAADARATDPMTKAHLKYIEARMKKTLDMDNKK